MYDSEDDRDAIVYEGLGDLGDMAAVALQNVSISEDKDCEKSLVKVERAET